MRLLTMGGMEAARLLVKTIKALGYEAYIVGGTVRDILLNTVADDIDIATNCPMEELRLKFRTHDITKKKFEHLDLGVLLVSFQGTLFDVAQFRTEKGYDGRCPSEVKFVQSLEEDVKRRDFTINALAMDEDYNVIDYVGGREDLEKRVVRSVGDPEQRFKEDYLRMMRAARFAAKTGFVLDKGTAKAIQKLANNINKMSAERISMEIIKAARMSSLEFSKFIKILSDLGLLRRILPEIDALKYLKHNLKFHPEGITVFDHVIETIKAVSDDIALSYVVKIAALLHDIGKSTTFSEGDGLPHYYRHEQAGKGLVEDVLKRLRFMGSIADPVLFAVSNHMLFTNMDNMKRGKVARIVSHPFFRILVEVGRADSKSRGAVYHNDKEFDDQIRKFEEIRNRWEKFLGAKPLNIVDGNRIMELTSLGPGRAIGKIKKAAEEKVIELSINPLDTSRIDDVILEAYHEITKGVVV